MRLSTLFYDNRRLSLLVIGLILVAGLAAFNSLPRQEDPILTNRYASVITVVPGASAQRVDALVTEKIENILTEIEEIHQLKSTSRSGVSSILIQLEDDVAKSHVDALWSKVRDTLSQVEPALPVFALAPELNIRKSPVSTYMIALTWHMPDPVQLDLLGRIAKDLDRLISPIPGTVETEIFGAPEEEFIVTLDPDALISVGLRAQDVSRAIARSDAKNSAGVLRSARNSLVLEVGGILRSEDSIRNIPLLDSGKDRTIGQFLKVGDVARVTKGIRSPVASLALINGARGILIGAKVDDAIRVDHWISRIEQRVARFKQSVPEGIRIEAHFNQDVYTQSRLGGLVGNILIGAMIIIGVMIFMMGWRSALLVASALPLTILMVLAAFNFMGIPLHQMSITGLIIALGLLIDNAIVAVDEYRKSRRAGVDIAEAISATVSHLFVPLLASTATTSLTFMPIVLSPGATGEFIGTIGLAVIVSLFSSLFLAMTLIPALAGYFDSGVRQDGRPSIWRNGYSNQAWKQKYGEALSWLLAHPKKGVALSLILPILGFGLSITLVQQFFPPVDRDQFQIQLRLPSQSSIAATSAQIIRARAVLESYPEIIGDTWVAGKNPPAVFYNTYLNQNGVSSFAGGYVTTVSAKATHKILPRLQRDLMAALPEAVVLAIPYEQGPPFDAPVEINLYGQDLDVLSARGEEIRALLAQSRNVTYTQAVISRAEPKLNFVPFKDEAALAGLKSAQIADQLNGALEGFVGGSVLEGVEELPVRVRLGGADRSRLDHIMNNPLLNSQGVESRSRESGSETRHTLPGVSLTALGKMELVPTYGSITRIDGQRVNKLQAFIIPFTLPSVALKSFEEKLENAHIDLPTGYRLEIAGAAEKRQESEGKLFSTVLPLMVVMMGILVLAFNSFTSALIIGAVAFLSAGLALLSLWVFGFPMGFTGIMGSMGLIGLAINDSIVVLAALRADGRARAADVDAIVQIVVDSSRHIFSTTLTTIGGFLPLILWGGVMWPPLATAISGGMVGATFLALVFVPCLYYMRVRRRANRRACRHQEKASGLLKSALLARAAE